MSCFKEFINLFIHWFVHSFVCSFVCSFFHSFVRSFSNCADQGSNQNLISYWIRPIKNFHSVLGEVFPGVFGFLVPCYHLKACYILLH